MKTYLPLLLAATTSLIAAPNNNCSPKPPAPCNYAPQCGCQYCLGPAKPISNAPVCPKTCGGDFIFGISALYWGVHEDGLEYAVYDNIFIEDPPTASDIVLVNQLVEAKVQSPHFKWNWGFKVDLGYCSPCDGWDFELIWTWYRGKALHEIMADTDSNAILVNLWTAYASPYGTPNFSRDIFTDWRLQLDLVDFELGRNFWASKYLSLRPFIGVRYANLRQKYDITSKGGIFTTLAAAFEALAFVLPPQVDFVKLTNHFDGAGILAGLDSYWNVGCGFAVYGHIAASLVYGRFDVDLHEDVVFAETRLPPILPVDFTGIAGAKTKIVDGLHDHFHATRGILDLELGVQWSTLYCDCKYGFTGQIGWEQHLFLHQNQLWSVQRVDATLIGPSPATFLNSSGENNYRRHRGNLDTGGLTVTARFEF